MENQNKKCLVLETNVNKISPWFKSLVTLQWQWCHRPDAVHMPKGWCQTGWTSQQPFPDLADVVMDDLALSLWSVMFQAHNEDVTASPNSRACFVFFVPPSSQNACSGLKLLQGHILME